MADQKKKKHGSPVPIAAEKIIPVNIEDEMKNCYIDYAMSVLIDRALPDVRDGLKPVHRRILYAMHDLGMTPDKPFRKSARIVGEVLGKYHPHGDASVYDAMVRLAQDFSMRYPLVWGQGNFGSIDGDGAAAMRYTEAKMMPLTETLMTELGKKTVDFRPNFDESEQEPVVLPAPFPNLLVNGTSGIAVGMAANVAPHNMGEVIDGTILAIDNPNLTIDELMTVIPGPDFPTGGIINGAAGIRDAYTTGKGRMRVRARLETRPGKRGKTEIVITEIPYMTNKSRLVEKIAAVAKERKAGRGIADVRDESGRDGIAIVVDVKKDADPNIVIQALYQYTDLETTFGYNMLALVDGQPKQLSLPAYLSETIAFRRKTLKKRLKFDLKTLEDRIEILVALVRVLDDIDRAITIIRHAKTVAQAREGLREAFALNARQAQAVLDMRLQKLTGLERERLEKELAEAQKQAEKLRELLASQRKMDTLIKKELREIKKKFGDERRTTIFTDAEKTVDLRAAIREDITVEMTAGGYLAGAPRGTENFVNSKREGDPVRFRTDANTGDALLLFDADGNVHRRRIDDLDLAAIVRKAAPHRSVFFEEMAQDPLYMMAVGDAAADDSTESPDRNDQDILFVTACGLVKRLPLRELRALRRNKAAVIRLGEGDHVVSVIPIPSMPQEGEAEITLVTEKGLGITFDVSELRPMGRTAAGVMGMRLGPGDHVVTGVCVQKGQSLTLCTDAGFVRRIKHDHLKLQKRAGKGEVLMKCVPMMGKVIGAFAGDFRVDDGNGWRSFTEDELKTTSRAKSGKQLATGILQGFAIPGKADLKC